MTTSSMTQISAVNIMLGSISHAPISSLTAPLTATVALAQNILDEVRREVLADGWAFNTDEELVMQPDAITSEIVLNSAILRVDGSSGRNGNMNLTQRMGKLYDKKEQTYLFTTNVYTDVIYNMEFTDIPDVARNYIAKRASRIFVDRTFTEASTSQLFRQEEFEALVKLRKHESNVVDANMLTGSYFTSKMLNRRNPFNRY